LKNTKGEKIHCFHNEAVMSTVGSGPKLVIGFEMSKPGQDSASKDEGRYLMHLLNIIINISN